MAISCTALRKPWPHNPISESQTLPDNPRGGLFLCRASVGEDSILPRGASPRSCTLLGEFVQFRTRNHSTKHAETETWREADSLPYSGWAILMDNKKQAAFFYEAACGYLSDFGGFFKGTPHNGARRFGKRFCPNRAVCLMCGARSVPCIWGR